MDARLSLALIGGLISILLMIRHTRVEEETGRRELLASGVIGRHAPLAAALAVVLAANLLHGLLSVPALVAGGLPTGSSLLFGLSTAAGGWAFAAVAAVTGQLTASSGTARGIAIAIGGLLFALRSLADTGGIGWLAWLTPFGWVRLTRPYAGDQWWVLGLIAVFAAALAAVAFTLSTRRDVAGGLISVRLGPAEERCRARSACPLACTAAPWRVSRSVSSVGRPARRRGPRAERPAGHAAVPGAGRHPRWRRSPALGCVLHLCDVRAQPARRGGGAGVGAARPRGGVGGPGRAAVVHPRWPAALGAEPSGVRRREPGAAVDRAGRCGGLTFDGDLARVTGATLAYLPAVWTVVGIATLLSGLLPRLAAAVSWTALGLFLVVDLLAEFKLATGIILDLSPFVHVPATLLGSASSPAAPLLGLTVVAITLTAAGLAFLRRRDLMPTA
ncbi:ABC transporter permease [Nonomuraea thailandensis]